MFQAGSFRGDGSSRGIGVSVPGGRVFQGEECLGGWEFQKSLESTPFVSGYSKHRSRGLGTNSLEHLLHYMNKLRCPDLQIF